MEKKLPDIYEHADEALKEATAIHEEYTEVREKFVKDNKLDAAEVPE